MALRVCSTPVYQVNKEASDESTSRRRWNSQRQVKREKKIFREGEQPCASPGR